MRRPPIQLARFLRRFFDALIASDPGLGRLRMGLSGAVNVAVVMVVEFALATTLNIGAQGTTVFMLLGSVVALTGANALADHDALANLRAAAFFPVAIAIGLVVGALVSPFRLLALVTFVIVMFFAVWMRRFGLNFFFYGFMLWMGFFFASFLQVTFAQLPLFLLAVVVGTAVVLILCCTVFLPHPRRTLARIFRSMNARTRALSRACASLLRADASTPAGRRASRVVFDARARVNDASLMSDGWAANARALPEGWTASALRARLLELQLGLDRLTIGSRALVASGASIAVRELAARALTAFAEDDRPLAREQAEQLVVLADAEGESVRDAAWQVSRGVKILVEVPSRPVLSKTIQQNEHEFVPAAALILGQLPGSPSVASGIDARGQRWNPLARLSFPSRQAVQVAVAGALAIAVGSAISGQRYYWAVIAAFVSFAGTGTRFETTRKSLNRVIGTLLGLGAGILLAHFTSGHTILALAVIVVSIFLGNYLMRVSYAYFIFFLTIMLSELYSILGEFSDQLLVLRLVETIAGAAIGIAVALVVAPISTRDTIRQSQRAVVGAIGELMDASARRASDPTTVSAEELDALIFTADNEMRRLTLVGTPLTRYQLWENRPRAVRRRLTTVAATVSVARTIATATRALKDPDPELADELTQVAQFARGASVKETAARRRQPATDFTDTRTVPIAIGKTSDIYASLARLQALLEELEPGESSHP